jgi:hypothetical protein
MSNQPEALCESKNMPTALRLADSLAAGFSDCGPEAAAELRRLHQFERGYNEWTEKTQWVQETKQTYELGMHRADVLKQRIEKLETVNQELRKALREAALALAHATETMPVVHDDDYNRVSAAIAKVEGA